MALGIPVGTLLHGSAGVRPITPYELQEWAAFEQVNGPLLTAERLELSMAILAYLTVSMNSKPGANVTVESFLPVWDAAQAGGGQSVEDMIATFKGVTGSD